jgi:hypothetical protein
MYLRRLIAITLVLATPALLAQRHGGRSAPPTAPFATPVVPVPIVAASSGLGAIQFAQVNYGVPAPQALTRQLRFDDDRTRASALSAIGSPPQYLQRGHIPMPRSVDLELVPLGGNDELDALLTVELDQHIVTAVLLPADGNWRRIATLTFATPFEDAATTPTTWVRTVRSLVQKDRYRAIFHASQGSMSGNFQENEAQLRVINGKAIVTLSFESTARECTVIPPPGKAGARNLPKAGCTVTQRWFQPDPADPTKHFVLVTATGHMSSKDLENPLAPARTMMMSHLRDFSCQPFVYSETTLKYEPVGVNAACREK